MGKIIDFLRNNAEANRQPSQVIDNQQAAKPDEPKASERAAKALIDAGNAAGRVLAPIVFVLFIGAVGAYAWNIIELMFSGPLQQIGAILGLPVSHFASAASVGMAFVMIILSKYSPHNAVRGGATWWAVFYLALTFALVFIAWGLQASETAKSAAPVIDPATGEAQTTALGDVVGSFSRVLPFMPTLGSAAVIVLAVAGLFCFGTLAATSKNSPTRFESEDRAKAHLFGNLVKVIVALSSVGFSVWFGSQVLGADVALAVLLGLVLDIGLIVSWQKSEYAAAHEDWHEARKWRTWAYIYGGAVAVMALESVGTQFKAAAIKEGSTMSPQLVALVNSDLFGILQTIGAVAIMAAIGLSVVQLLLTMRPIRPVAAGDEQPHIRIADPWPTRIANRIHGTRAGINEVRNALRGNANAPGLPAPALAKDAPDNVPEFSAVERAAIQAALSDYVAKQKAHKKQAENGTGYDATGALVLTPEQDAELRAAGGGNEPGK